jgi:hypothetical protein
MLKKAYSKILSFTRFIHIPILLFDRILYILLWAIVGITILHITYIVSSLKGLPEIIFLHRNIYFGVDLLGEWYYIFTLPIISIVLSTFNAIISRICYTRSRLFSYFLIVGALVVSTVLMVGSVLIVNDNI